MSLTAQKLTEEQKKEYLKNNGNLCPHCRSDHITATGYWYAENLTAHRKVECYECGEEWMGVFTMTGVTEA